MKRSLIFLLVIASLTGCCKNEIIEIQDDPLIGNWSLISAIFGGYPNVPESLFMVQDTLQTSGTIEFKKDGTGRLEGDIEEHFCYANDFTWVKNDSLNRIFFILGLTFMTDAIILETTMDTLMIDVRDKCVSPPVIGGYYAFRYLLVKNE